MNAELGRGSSAGLRSIETGAFEPQADDVGVGVAEKVDVLRRHARTLGLWILVCLSVSSFYLYVATPEFLATTEIVLQPRQPFSAAMDPSGATIAGPALDSAQADSQVEVIQSERNLRFVFDTLGLADDPEYKPTNKPGLVRRVLSLIPFLSGKTELLQEKQASISTELAYKAFSSNVSVHRLGQSYAFELSFRAQSPAKAARLANAIAAAYIRDQVLFNSASNHHRAEFLEDRISDIKTQLDVAMQSVKDGTIPDDFQFSDSDARIVSNALPPLTKAYPQTKLILLWTIAFALISGIGVIAVRESLDRTVRAPEQVRRSLGMYCLGVFPRVGGGSRWRRNPKKISYRFAFDSPNTDFAQTLRTLRTSIFAADEEASHVSVGVISCMPGEGKTTIASNLAFLLATSGDSVFLVDADFRNPTLTRELAPDAALSLTETLGDSHVDISCAELPLTENLAFIPAVSAGSVRDPNLFPGSPRMAQTLKSLSSARHIIVDLPPLNASSDALAIGRLLGGVILIAAVNHTSLDQLSQAARAMIASDVRVFGIVLNEPRIR
jgi:polysaccharide biosynthesis transport protein